MTNLEKLTAGEVAARNNGTLEQLREVIGHCFPNKPLPDGNNTLYYKSYNSPMWVSWHTCKLPTIPITQLWEELQALKKPEIWWIRATEENKETLEKWLGSILQVGYITGIRKFENKLGKGYSGLGIPKSEYYDFGQEIDFATFLKYTGVEVEKPTNEIILPETWGGEIEGLPAPILKRMMECQVEQGNKADHTVFEKDNWSGHKEGAFMWSDTKEGVSFWVAVLSSKQYQKFFEMYPETKPEKVEKSLEEKLNEISRLSDLRNDILERNKSLVKEFNEIETQISALLK